jgi:tetratricopeptide (TPR) repeat protein
LRLGDFDAAEGYLAKYSNVKGATGELVNAMAVGIRGEIAVEKGDYAGAAAIFEKAANVSDNNYSAPLYLRKAAMAYAAAGNAAKAQECLQTINDKYPSSIEAREAEKLAERGIPSQILPRYRMTNFSHTMGGGYTAGYYSYMWAEVLDADAFDAFAETGDIFNQEVAAKFRKYVLTPGGIDDGMTMYKNFRGREPQIDALLRNRGL